MDRRGRSLARRDPRLHRPEQLRVVREIHRRAESLTRFPERGYRYHDLPERDIRILLWGHYRIAYLVHDSSDLEILGVFHGALDAGGGRIAGS